MNSFTTNLMLLAAVLLFAGCKAGIPNAVFNCVEDSDCPPSFFCHQSQSLCFDTPETCVKTRSCGGVYECGTIDDGCGEFIECESCEEGETCGASGNEFTCGCQPLDCTFYQAECGAPPTGCEFLLDCNGTGPGTGGCLEDYSCNENTWKCECTAASCNSCDPPCSDDDICVDGACQCNPRNCVMQGFECNSYDGNTAMDGCGGVLPSCGTCDGGESCGEWASSDNAPYKCGGCTCEDNGYECGNPTICGEEVTAECGFCTSGEHCGEDFKCKCEDEYDEEKRNDQIGDATNLGTVEENRFLKRVDATLDNDSDVDWYKVKKPHVDGSTVSASIIESVQAQKLAVFYQCPSDSDGELDCILGERISTNGLEGCASKGDTATVAFHQACEKEGEASVFVRVSVDEWEGECAPYVMRVQNGDLLDPPSF